MVVCAGACVFVRACVCVPACLRACVLACVCVILYLHSPSRSVRSSADTRLLKFPLYTYKTKDDRTFSHFDTSVWNSLPPHIGNAATITTFSPLNLYQSDVYILTARSFF